MRFAVKKNNKWVKETPEDVSKWLWRNDGIEAVAVDDENQIYYCSLPSMIDTYREAWERERKPNDQRRADLFYTLDRSLFEKEAV